MCANHKEIHSGSQIHRPCGRRLMLLRMKVKGWVDGFLSAWDGSGWCGWPRAKAQVLGLVPAALLCRLTAFVMRAPVRRPHRFG